MACSHLEGPSSPLDICMESCMDSCIVRDHTVWRAVLTETTLLELDCSPVPSLWCQESHQQRISPHCMVRFFAGDVKHVTEGREGEGRGGDQLGFGVLIRKKFHIKFPKYETNIRSTKIKGKNTNCPKVGYLIPLHPCWQKSVLLL